MRRDLTDAKDQDKQRRCEKVRTHEQRESEEKKSFSQPHTHQQKPETETASEIRHVDP